MELINEIKNKKLLAFTVAISIILIAVVFLISVFVGKNKKPENPVAPVTPKEKSMEEVMEDLTAPVKEGEKAAPVPDEIIKSLTAPVADNDTTATSKKSKAVQPTPIPVSKDVINSLTAPANK